jgi:hypothetical protein
MFMTASKTLSLNGMRQMRCYRTVSSVGPIWLPVHADPIVTKHLDERMAQLLTPALQDQPTGRTQACPAVKAHEKEATPRPKAA